MFHEQTLSHCARNGVLCIFLPHKRLFDDASTHAEKESDDELAQGPSHRASYSNFVTHPSLSVSRHWNSIIAHDFAMESSTSIGAYSAESAHASPQPIRTAALIKRIIWPLLPSCVLRRCLASTGGTGLKTLSPT